MEGDGRGAQVVRMWFSLIVRCMQCCKRGAETRTRPAEHHRETPRMTEKRRDVTRNVETKREFRRKKKFAGKPRFDRARNVLPAPQMTAMI
jgi:hypothetical protein